MRALRTLLTSLGLALVPALAAAHTGVGATHGLAAGILHPLTGLDHLLAMVAMGLLAGIGGGHARWLLPLGFVSAMLAGAGLALAGASLPLVETLILASVIAFGALAVLRIGLPTAAVLAVVAVFGLFHGFAHGLEAPLGGTIGAYLAGFTVATALLHAAGVVLAQVSPRAVRYTGGAVLALGLGLAAGVV